jgi:hypothetical protein
MSLVADPAWHAQVRDEGLVVYAGADLAYLIPDLPRAVAVALAGLFEPVLRGVARTVDESRLGEPVSRHVAQLRTLGALRPAGLPSDEPKPMGVGTRFVGQAPAGLVERLPHNDDPDLLLVVRTTGTLVDLIEVARETTVPHLLLDHRLLRARRPRRSTSRFLLRCKLFRTSATVRWRCSTRS